MSTLSQASWSGKVNEKWSRAYLIGLSKKNSLIAGLNEFAVCKRQHLSNMATKQPLKTTFEVDRVIRPIFTGGSVSIDNNAQILATTIGEDAILTNPTNGRHLGEIEGVRYDLAPNGKLFANAVDRMESLSQHSLVCCDMLLPLERSLLTSASDTFRFAPHCLLSIAIHANFLAQKIGRRNLHQIFSHQNR